MVRRLLSAAGADFSGSGRTKLYNRRGARTALTGAFRGFVMGRLSLSHDIQTRCAPLNLPVRTGFTRASVSQAERTASRARAGADRGDAAWVRIHRSVPYGL